MRLPDIRNDEWVILDTNILIYANQRKSAECVQLLRRCALLEVKGIVPMPMAAELVHTLMLIEARENGWIDRHNPARVLSEKPDLVRRLSRYALQVREFLGIGLRIEPAVPVDILDALSVQRDFGLLTNDALLLAVARRLNCTAVATADGAFDVVKGFAIYSPSDVEA